MVLEYTGQKRWGNCLWLCQCDCGRQLTVLSNNLSRGYTKSCGCLRHNRLKTHGLSKSRTYAIWRAMRMRCANMKDASYPYYGARGIKVCERWRSFENFLADMGKRPSPEYSLDRYPDNDGNYEPGNVRWATQKEQSNNTRHNVWIEFNGERRTVRQWAKTMRINECTLHRRLRSGWSTEKALTEKVR